MKNANQKYPPTNSIAVDVDGTLHTNGVVNARVVEFCRTQKARGFVLTLWSARGKKYAQAAAERFGVEELFDDIVSKPVYVLDDQGWNWIKYTHVIRSLTETPNVIWQTHEFQQNRRPRRPFWKGFAQALDSIR